MSILCAILEYDPRSVEASSTLNNPRRTVFPVLFQVPSTNEYMTCSSSKIKVDSVRWPHTRFTSIENAKLPLLNLLKTSDPPTTIDAAVWIMPLCGGGALPAVCNYAFTQAACYPYCLAVRQSSSFNSILTAYNAPNWLDRVHIFNRDCAMHLYSKNGQEGITNLNIGVQSVSAPTSLLSDSVGANAFASLLSSLNYGGVASSILQAGGGSGSSFQYTSSQVRPNLHGG